ncbi:MAG: TetR family transcriptional regulator C-terminal domain-containing protein [Defluviimonas sp.]|uniref:TetR/AcrR family transcriptional regulator n=1 Tax=Albidovulum sp. TaxID=1872424 RepID=UPI001E02F7B3|nr:TetR family transcriptional regulator C-terminal domain-containing protein [Paracoccaceae bacterium]MCC0064385.1 TetR family transcriptional regulator C-terminal domain-containing protein [Defluviimonas sp.]
MAETRRTFTRDDPESRRADLVAAVLDLTAEAGPQGVTVRAIAERAGVTQGLIRHYFATKEALIDAAYTAHMAAQTEAARAAAGPEADPPLDRLRRFIAASLTPPVSDSRTISLWAGFIHLIRRDPAMLATHERSYLAFRDQLQALIVRALAERDRLPGADEARRLAIACNAVLDGLWFEAGALPDAFAPGEIVAIGSGAIGTILALPLANEKER